MKIRFTQCRDLEGSGKIVKPGDTLEATDPAEVAVLQAYVNSGFAVIDKPATTDKKEVTTDGP